MRSLRPVLPFFLTPALALAQAAKPISAGTEIKVRMIDPLSSETAKVGDLFHATLENPVLDDGKPLYSKGADVTGTVVAAHASGRLSDPGSLSLVLNTITSDHSAASIEVQPLEIKGGSHTKGNAAKMGGGKGAAIGAGGAAGTGTDAATGKKDAKIESEAVLTFIASVEPAPGATPAATASSETTPAGDRSTALSEEADGESNPADSSVEEKSAASTSFVNSVPFTARDRRVIRNCVNEHAAEFPQETLDRKELPPGSEPNVRVGGTLPHDLEAEAQSLPLVCEEQLPKLPNDQERVVYTGRVLLLDSSGRILDMFDLQQSE